MGRLGKTHGHNGWWPMLAHRRKHMDGTMTGRECFVDMRNGTVVASRRSGWGTKDLPYATGETSSLQHQTDAFRENFDRIDWNGGKVEAAPDVHTGNQGPPQVCGQLRQHFQTEPIECLEKSPKSQEQKTETHDGHGQRDPAGGNACGKIAGCGRDCQQHEPGRPEQILPAPRKRGFLRRRSLPPSCGPAPGSVNPCKLRTSVSRRKF